MPDFSFKSLLSTLAAQPPQESLWSGLAQPPQTPNNDYLSPQDQLLAKQRMFQMRDQTQIPTLNPGQTWGGMDKNNVGPQDVMQARFYSQPPENI